MISVNQVAVTFGGFDLFSGISFQINERDRIGLVGKNGAGKTTLLKIIIGIMMPDSGNVVVPDGMEVAYLPQQMIHSDGKTVFDETMSAFAEIIELEKSIEAINIMLAERNDHNSAEYFELIEKLTESSERYHLLGGSSIHADVEQMLLGLGFKTSDFQRQTSEFSGGWRMRIELAKLLLQKPDLFLLDEPTNHLDIESIQWLENFLQTYPGAVVVISHDRAFLDNVTKRTIEISLGKIFDYKASWSRYVELRKERREQQMAAYRNQQKLIDDTEQFIERFRYKATKAVQVQSRIKQLDKIDIIEIEEEDKSSINVRFAPAPRSGAIVAEIKNLSKSYGNKKVLNDLNLNIERGDKVAFVGRNGEGKTTLSKIIVEQLDFKGTYKKGHNVSIGYFAQNQDELLENNRTVFQTIDDIATGDIRTKVRDILGAFLFGGESVDKKVKVLSGGERSRLAIAKLLLEPYNLLVLDEPTNHLDMHSKDVLKQALIKYDGTLVIVSHDRDFLDGLVSKVYEFKDQKIFEHLGGIYDFLQKKKLESLQALEINSVTELKENKKGGDTTNKILWEKRKEIEKDIRKVENRISKSESAIEKLETEIEKMDKLLSLGNQNSSTLPDPNFYSDYEQKKRDLTNEMGRWEKLHREAEKLKKQKDQT